MKIFIVRMAFTLLELKNYISHEKVCKSTKWCKIVTPNKENNQSQKLIKIPFVIYIGFETIL